MSTSQGHNQIVDAAPLSSGNDLPRYGAVSHNTSPHSGSTGLETRDAHKSEVGGKECIVCLEKSVAATSRPCCSKCVCTDCMVQIVRLSVTEGIVHIKCPNPECDKALTDQEIVQLIGQDANLKSKYDRFRLDHVKDGNKKACPRCCLITEHKLPRKFRLKENDVKLKCTSCDLEWCFKCHAPWHEGLTCKAFRTGEKEFEQYTKERQSDRITPNCQKCPLCRIYIERNEGCPHMTCNRCGTGFCYYCGEAFVIPLLSDIFHDSKYSFLGCKYRYEEGGTFERLAVRGTYGTAIIAFCTGYPILFAGGVALIAAGCLIALPFYAIYKVYRICRRYRAGDA